MMKKQGTDLQNELNNRRKTSGRRTYFQIIAANKAKGTPERVIKHLQKSVNQLMSQVTILKHLEMLTRNMLSRSSQKPMEGTVIWNSGTDGTYIKSKHGNIGRRKNGNSYE